MTMTSPPASPSLSVVIPARNASETIEACLEAVFAQEYQGPIDVTVAVGPGHDDTRKIVDDWATRDPRLQVINNPDGRTPCALNLAIASSSGEIVARVDAQSVLPPGYLQRAVATLLRTGAANVGGVQHPVGNRGMQLIIAVAMRSAFGSGPASFRGHGQAGPTDTVYLGTFTRRALDQVGGFDESLTRNQDYELNWRLRRAGYTVWLDPALRVDYQARPTLRALAAQYVQYGGWKRRMLWRNPRSLRLRQLAAPALVLGLLGSGVALALGNIGGLAVPAIYSTALFFAACRVPERLRTSDRLRLTAAFVTMHLAWGSGMLASSWFSNTTDRRGPPVHPR